MCACSLAYARERCRVQTSHLAPHADLVAIMRVAWQLVDAQALRRWRDFLHLKEACAPHTTWFGSPTPHSGATLLLDLRLRVESRCAAPGLRALLAGRPLLLLAIGLPEQRLHPCVQPRQPWPRTAGANSLLACPRPHAPAGWGCMCLPAPSLPKLAHKHGERAASCQHRRCPESVNESATRGTVSAVYLHDDHTRKVT